MRTGLLRSAGANWLVLVVVLCCWDWTNGENPPRVLAKLHPSLCQGHHGCRGPTGHSAGNRGPTAALRSVQARVQNVGLEYESDLPIPCWCILRPAATRAATRAAMQALTAPGSMNMVAAGDGNSAAAAGTSQMFVIAMFDRPIKLRPIYEEGPPPLLQQQQTPSPPTTAAATAAAAAAEGSGTAAAPRPLSLPPECGAGSCRNWGMNRIRAPELWEDMGSLIPFANITQRGMVIDTGVDITHYDAAPQIDVNSSVTFASDEGDLPAGGVPAAEGHGSHVFGIAAAGWGPYAGEDDPTGVAGVVGPAQNQMVSCNCFGTDTSGYDSDIVKCIAHSMDVNAHWVINLSLGSDTNRTDGIDQLYRDAFGPFCAAGGIAVAAAGNGVCVGGGCAPGGQGGIDYVGVDISNAGLQPDGTIQPGYASYPAVMAEFFPDCVIAVASIDQSDRLAKTSNWGKAVRIAAPGSYIFSSFLARRYRWQGTWMSGTSMASPHVTGAALLLRNAFPNATNTQVVNCMFSTADKTVLPYATDTYINGGILNVRAAYDCLAPSPLFSCKKQAVPPCVDAASGVKDPGCADPYFCLTVPVNGSTNDSASSNVSSVITDLVDDDFNGTINGTTGGGVAINSTTGGTDNSTGEVIICRYNHKPATLVCNPATGSTCNGTAECPVIIPPPVQNCSSPPPASGAQYNASCAANTPAGSSCNATCREGFGGAGYAVDCLANGTWGVPYGPGCTVRPPAGSNDTNNTGGTNSTGGVVITCGTCKIPLVCSAAQGCKCQAVQSRGNRCSCAANRGLSEYMQGKVKPKVSRCGWNVRWPWSGGGNSYLLVPRNALVAFTFTVGRPPMCPFNRRTVVAYPPQVGMPVVCPGHNAVAIRLRATTSALGESCNRSTGISKFVFNTRKPRAQVGECYRVKLYTTDNDSRTFTIKFSS